MLERLDQLAPQHGLSLTHSGQEVNFYNLNKRAVSSFPGSNSFSQCFRPSFSQHLDTAWQDQDLGGHDMFALPHPDALGLYSGSCFSWHFCCGHGLPVTDNLGTVPLVLLVQSLGAWLSLHTLSRWLVRTVRLSYAI